MAERAPTPPLGTPRNLLKDLEVIDRRAQAGGLAPNLLSAAIPRYREALARGLGDQDVARMIDLVACKETASGELP
jgi:3-hydroxyisobutyrate dehydrogenase-like beta-hydroxyacid dehydrogenase